MKWTALTVGVLALLTVAHALTPVEQQLAELYKMLAGLRVGMIANPTSVDEHLNFLPDVLALSPNVPFNITVFFAPEHGIRGDKQAGATVEDYYDPVTGRMVYSLHGSRRGPSDEQLQLVDALLFDVQDVGVRFYTYVWTMTYAMEAAARNGKTFVVLDRPNPLGADVVEGPPNTMDAGIIGRKWPNAPFGVPTRHGMTAGEIAAMCNAEWMSPKVDLRVVVVPGYKRSDSWASLNRPWVLPSPNMPTFDGTVPVYPGTGLFEDVKGASEGRGTTRPFELIGLPAAADARAAEALTAALNDKKLPGVHFRTAFFVPTFGDYINKPCGGVQVHVTNTKTFQPVWTGLEMVKTMQAMFPQNVTLNKGINSKSGIADLQTKLPVMTVQQLYDAWQPLLKQFLAIRAKYLLYL